MADFAEWASACGDGFLWDHDAFAAAYGANRHAMTSDVIEADAIAAAIHALMTARLEMGLNTWTGTATQLLM